MKKHALVAAMLCTGGAMHAWAAKQHTVQGMVVEVNAAKHAIVISCDAIPGYMDAMAMPFKVRDAATLKGIEPGSTVRFTMTENAAQDYAEHLQTIKITNNEAEPTEAGRLAFLHHALDPGAAARSISLGKEVPDFTLTDPEERAIHLAQFKGKIVALTFAYSRCPNPNYCFRLSNNLALLRRRFPGHSADDLILITIVIDPANDKGTALREFAQTWKADPAQWYFLTGPLIKVQGVAELFGMSFWSDEGFLTHSFHTVVIDREGRLAANLEGNKFSSRQLGDLVERVSRRPASTDAATP